MFPDVKFQLRVLPECDSTNTWLLAQREQADFHGSAVLALKQNAGQGRRSRPWFTGQGNLALSVGFRVPPAVAPLLPFTAGIALAQLLDHLPIRLKWPNDIYLKEKKLAGMLSQAKQLGDQLDLVIGIGLNLQEAPPKELASVPATALSEYGHAPLPEPFALDFLRAWESLLPNLKSFEELSTLWEKYARLKGQKVSILGENIELVEAQGLSPTGELAVRDGKGNLRLLSSEEISLRLE